jgi:hypothetical protein
VATAILCSLGAAFYSSAPVEPLPIVAFVLFVGPLLAVISWLQKDARRTGVGAVHDLGFFLWLGWPVLIPWCVEDARLERLEAADGVVRLYRVCICGRYRRVRLGAWQRFLSAIPRRVIGF